MPRFHRNRVAVILCDAFLIAVAFVLSYALRFNFDIPPFYFDQMKRALPFFVALNLIVFFMFDLYKGCGGIQAFGISARLSSP